MTMSERVLGISLARADFGFGERGCTTACVIIRPLSRASLCADPNRLRCCSVVPSNEIETDRGGRRRHVLR